MDAQLRGPAAVPAQVEAAKKQSGAEGEGCRAGGPAETHARQEEHDFRGDIGQPVGSYASGELYSAVQQTVPLQAAAELHDEYKELHGGEVSGSHVLG